MQQFDKWIADRLSGLSEEITILTKDDALLEEVTPSWTSRPARAMIVQNDTRMDPLDDPPSIRHTLCFILPQPRFLVHSGDRAEYSGQTFDIARVKVCKDLDGNVMAYRCECIR